HCPVVLLRCRSACKLHAGRAAAAAWRPFHLATRELKPPGGFGRRAPALMPASTAPMSGAAPRNSSETGALAGHWTGFDTVSVFAAESTRTIWTAGPFPI